MDWVKTAVHATILWLGLAIAVGAGFVWYVTKHPMGREVDQARLARAGDLTGKIAGVGVGLTWLGLYARSNLSSRRPRKKKKRRSTRPGGLDR